MKATASQLSGRLDESYSFTTERKTGRKQKHHNRAEDWKKAKASQQSRRLEESKSITTEQKTGRKQKHHNRAEDWKKAKASQQSGKLVNWCFTPSQPVQVIAG